MICKDELIGSRIILRTVRESDCNDSYLKWMNDFETNYYLETRWNEQNLNTIIDFVNNIALSQDCYLFAIIDKQTGLHIGNIKLGPIIKRYNYSDISYFIGEKRYRGLGYAREAITLVCDFGFNVLQLHRIQAGVIEGNIKSERALIATGFSLEGRLRHKFIRNGKYLDHLIYAKINS